MAKVQDQLAAHEAEYVSAAEEWNHRPAGLIFCYFGNGRYRWGEFFIDRVQGGYKIGKGSNNGVVVADLATAAQQSGTNEMELQEWIAVSQKLKLYSIEKTYPAQGGYIQIDLWGSEWTPYGLRYAPMGNESAYAGLVNDVASKGEQKGYLRFLQLRDRWFYFESTRF